VFSTASDTTNSGYIAAGNTFHDLLIGRPVIAPLVNTANIVQPVRSGGVEIVWQPDLESEAFNLGSTRTTGDDQGVFVLASGLDSGAGVVVRATIIWEWWPKAIHSASGSTKWDSASPPALSIHSIKSALANLEPKWFVRAMNAVATLL